MSTPITLTVGDIELTYNTTYMGIDHGMLFQEIDRKHRRHRYISYEYYEQHPDEAGTPPENPGGPPVRCAQQQGRCGRTPDGAVQYRNG